MKGALIVGAALVAANFLFQAVTSKNWSTAFERSFFQLVAIGALVAQGGIAG